MGKFKDLTGKKFGRLTVLCKSDNYYISPKGVKHIKWICLCDCGNEVEVNGGSLKNGDTKSCGCLNTEKRALLGKSSKKYNKYDLSGEYGIGYTLKGEEFYFDLEDYDKIREYCWFLDNRGYVLTNAFYDKRRMIQMHRLLTDFPYKKDVDHINHNTKDNRKKNLRVCLHCDNQKNMKLSSRNTSGVTGVSWDKNKNKWVAYIQSNNNVKYLGMFSCFEDAIKARKKAERKYFGEYSYDNSITEKTLMNMLEQ